MRGDQLLIKAASWYNKNGLTPGTPVSPLNALISALISGVGGITNAAHGATPTQLQSSGVLIPGATSFYGSHNTADSTTKPKAFLNWVLLDDQFKYVASSSGFDQVGSDQQFKTHYVTPTMAKNGFLYVYVSNETPNINVYFDNLTVTHIKSPLLQEQSYYPFGLQMAGISDKALGKLDSKYKFDGGVNFEEDYGVNLYTTFYRTYDPQIGRFSGVDILSERLPGVNAYQFGANNPLYFNDPSGALSDADWKDFLERLEEGNNLSGFGPHGGYYSSTGGGGFTAFSSDAEAFGWGASYMTTNDLWGSQPGWAQSYGTAYSNFSDISASDGPKGYNYATSDFSYIYASSQYHGDLDYYCGANYYYSGYGNIFDFEAIKEGYQLQQSQVDWKGVFDASVGILGGVLEVSSGAALEFVTGGAATPLAIGLTADAGGRILGNFGRLIAAASGNKEVEDAIPANIGALVGKTIDVASGKSIYDYSYGQAIGGGVNDMVTLIATGGTMQAIANIQQEGLTVRTAVDLYFAAPAFINDGIEDFRQLSEKN